MPHRLRSSTLLLLAIMGASAVEGPALAEPDAAAIAKLVDQGGKDKPEWWDAVVLNYPPTLDLSCPQGKGGGWNPAVSPGAWFWDNINPNPGRWKEGAKFWHFVLANAKKNGLPEAERTATMSLGHCYGDLLQDWPRAIHWYQQAEAKYGRGDDRTVAIAHAQWRLGARSLALKTANTLTMDATRHGGLIKIHADLGDYAEAYRLAQAKVADCEDIGWFMAGYTAQLEGSWAKALDCFRKSSSAPQNRSGRDWKRTKDRAAAAMKAIALFETMDLKRIADGSYKDSSIGYVGPVEVQVTVAKNRIADVRVTAHHEKQYYAALTEVPAKIIAKQHVKGVDATLGATITSEAIVYATAKALAQGQR